MSKVNAVKIFCVLGRYTLVDNETMSLPNTPRSSFRESVRKSLRKLKRKKRQQKRVKNSSERSESKYEVTVTLKEAEEDIYDEIVHAEESITDPEHTEEIIIKEYASRKPFFRADDVNKSVDAASENEESETKTTTQVLLHTEEIESLLKDKEMEMTQFPRGPLGDLLKQKSLKNDVTVSNDTNSTNDGGDCSETAETQEIVDKTEEQEITATDREDVNEEEMKFDSPDDDESNSESRKTVLIDEGFVSLCSSSFHLVIHFIQN